MGLTLNGSNAAFALGDTPAIGGVVTHGGPYTAYATGTIPTDTETYQDGSLSILDSGDVEVYAHTPRFRGRGNSTWAAPKKPYKVRSLNREQRPFAFAPSRDWALMADYYDQSYIRSSVAFEIARRATGRWAPMSRPVRLFWNGTYAGLYRYSETVDVQAGRVAIRGMEDEDTAGNALTGPYLLEVNNPPDSPGFFTSRGTPVMYDSPDVDGVAEQEAYIQAWTETLETALVTGTEAEILALIDLPSWVDWYLLSESTRQIDSDWQKSCRWYKDQDAPEGTGKAILWPPWDYDLSLGLGWESTTSPEGWATRESATAGESTHPNWLWYLWERCAAFRAETREAWDEKYVPVLIGIGEYIDSQSELIAPLVSADRALWHGGTTQPQAHTAAWIKDWLSDRSAWITANL